MQKAPEEARGQNIDSCSALAVHHMPELGRKPGVLVHRLHQTPSSLPERSSPLSLAEVCIISLFCSKSDALSFLLRPIIYITKAESPSCEVI